MRPKLIVAGASAYPRAIDFEKMAEIAHGYGAYLMVDMAHIAGLVAGGSAPESRCRMLMLLPPPPTRRCAARAAA